MDTWGGVSPPLRFTSPGALIGHRALTYQERGTKTLTTKRQAPRLKKLPEQPGKRPYAIIFPDVRGRVFCNVDELQSLADEINDELDSLVQ